MDVLLITYNDAISLTGCFTSILDLYLNLRNFTKINMKIIFDIHPVDMMKYFKCQNFFGNIDIMSCLTKNKTHTSDVVIISCELLGQISKGLEVNIECDKLIVLDSLDLQRVKYNILPDLSSFLFSNNCILLSNPANFDIIDVETIEYYHKFNKTRLSSIEWYPQTLQYDRRNKKHAKMKESIYVENIGKSIFESIFLGSQVNYHGSSVKDGLYYYLKLFGIDGDLDHFPLNIDRDDVINHLFFDEKDKILGLI